MLISLSRISKNTLAVSYPTIMSNPSSTPNMRPKESSLKPVSTSSNGKAVRTLARLQDLSLD